VFLGNAMSYLAVLAGLLVMRSSELFVTARQPRTPGQLVEGVRYVRSRPRMVVPILLVFMVGTFGLNFQITLSLIAKETFHVGAGSFGLLTSALAVGSLLGALGSARRTGLPRLRTMLVAALGFGVLEAVCGFAPSFWLLALLLVPTGASVLTFTTTANAIVQLAAEPQVRGRVMALYLTVFIGGTPIGAPLIGLLAEYAGPRSSLWLGGAVCTLSAAAAALYLTRQVGLRVPALVRTGSGARSSA
jgi:predicted MFS family arabinose efflux permease